MTQAAPQTFLFDSPLEAGSAVGFAVLFWSVATAIHSIASNKPWLTEVARHSMRFFLLHGRPMTDAEARLWLPDGLLLLARGFGRICQTAGILLGVAGLTSLTHSLFRAIF